MSKKIVLTLVVVLVLVMAIILGVYFFFTQGPINSYNSLIETNNQKNTIPTITEDQELAQIKIDYPQTITGIINFFDKKNTYKTTIKTSDGTEYTLWPAEPKSIYEAFGAKDGQKVEVKAKILDDNRIEWKLMRPI